MRYTYEQPEYLDISGARHLVQELKVYIKEILDGNIDITQYATKDELKSYATKSYVDDAVTKVVTGGQVDLSNYYNKQEVDALIPEAITEDQIKALFTDEGLATETYVDDAVAKVDLSNYYTKDEVYNKEETDELIANVNTGGGSDPTPDEPVLKGTSSISGNKELKVGFTRAYTGSFLDSSGSAVSDVTGEWTINASFADNKFTTKTIEGNKITVGIDDDNLVGQSFEVTFSDHNGNYTPSTITVNIVEGW